MRVWASGLYAPVAACIRGQEVVGVLQRLMEQRRLPRTIRLSHYQATLHSMVTTNLPFDERTEVFDSERLTGSLLDCLTHHVHILEMNGESYRLKRSQEVATSQSTDAPHND